MQECEKQQLSYTQLGFQEVRNPANREENGPGRLRVESNLSHGSRAETRPSSALQWQPISRSLSAPSTYASRLPHAGQYSSKGGAAPIEPEDSNSP